MPPGLAALLADLVDAFPRDAISAQTVRVYARELADVPVDRLAQAVSDLIRTSRYFPRVAEIRERAAELALDLPGEADALEQVQARAAWARLAEDERGSPPPIHPAVKRALQLVGGAHAMRAADEPAVIRGQFLRLYRDVRAGEVTAAASRPQLELVKPAEPPANLSA